MGCSKWMDVTHIREAADTPLIASHAGLWVMEVQPAGDKAPPVDIIGLIS
jgi:hypothetical protein